jgi:hypothetical protein
MEAMFTHDCDKCIFLGHMTLVTPTVGKCEYDLYWCPESGSVVSRFGNEGGDYYSCQRGERSWSPGLTEATILSRRL